MSVIVVIDDESTVLTSLQTTIRGHFGHEVVIEAFECAIEAISFIERQPDEVALVITDWLMSNLRGDKVLVEVKHVDANIPVLMLSGYADNKSVDEAFEGGLLKFIKKPWENEDLIQAIQRYQRPVVPKSRSEQRPHSRSGPPASNAMPKGFLFRPAAR